LIFFPSSVIEIFFIVLDVPTIKSGRFFKDSKGIDNSFGSIVFIGFPSLHFLRYFSSRDSSVLSVNEIVVEFSFLKKFIQLFFFA